MSASHDGDGRHTQGGDHYDTLGVARDATTEEIKKAFRRLARECHPDVAGDSPDAQARFNRVRDAYEVLSDPVKRSSYDRRGHTYFAGPGRYGGRWRPPGGFDFEHAGDNRRTPPPRRRQGRKDPANDLGLDDLFNDFGFGADGGRSGGGRSGGGRSGGGRSGGGSSAADPGREAGRNRGSYGRPASSGPVSPGGGGSRGGGFQDTNVHMGTGGGQPRQGRDITMQVDVPARVSARGGTVTLRYPRLRRTEDGRGVARYDEIHDLRVPPGVRHGETLRVPRMGDAGLEGGPYGDLVCDLRVEPGAAEDDVQRRRGDRTAHTGPRPGERVAGTSAGGVAEGEDSAETLDITIAEALLGGRVRVETPAGPVRVTIPPCTDSGTRLRLRGRAADGSDHFVELRIVTPSSLDAESRSLVERFAELNPEDPE